MLIKTDSSGELEWGKTYGFGGALSVVQTDDLGYALCGTYWLLKTDADGNVQWNKTFEGLNLHSAIQASDGGYVIVGYDPNYGEGLDVSVLLKTDQNGNLLWNKTFTPSYSAYAPAVAETDDGDYMVAGTLGGDFWLAKTDNGGNLPWNKTYHHVSELKTGPSSFRSIAKTEDGGYILSGDDGRGAWLVKVDADGEEQWNLGYIVGERENCFFTSVVELADGGYIVAGCYFSPVYALLVRIDGSGGYVWNASYGTDNGRAYSVLAADDGGFVVAGFLDDNVWLAKFAPESQFWSSVVLLVAGLVVVTVVAVAFVVYKRNHRTTA